MRGSGYGLAGDTLDILIENANPFHQTPGKPIEHQELGLFCFFDGGIAEVAVGNGLPVNSVQVLPSIEEARVAGTRVGWR